MTTKQPATYNEAFNRYYSGGITLHSLHVPLTGHRGKAAWSYHEMSANDLRLWLALETVSTDTALGEGTLSYGRSNAANIMHISPRIAGMDPVMKADGDIRRAQIEKICSDIDPELYQAWCAIRDAADPEGHKAAVEAKKKELQEKQGSESLNFPPGDKDHAVYSALIDKEKKAYRETMVEGGLLSEMFEKKHPGVVREGLRTLSREESGKMLERVGTMLDAGGIAWTLETNPERQESWIAVNTSQHDYPAKAGELLQTHREAVLEKHTNLDFVITLPDGSALDKEQAARVIAQRRSYLREDEGTLDALAKEFGVTAIEQALQPRQGGWARGVASDDGASGD